MNRWQKTFFLVGTFLLLFGGFLFIKPFFCHVNKDAIDKQSLCCLINKTRYKNGLQSLKVNPKLEKVAELRAYDIAVHNQFTHKPTLGRTMGSVALEAGYKYSEIGENLARGFENNGQVFSAWMKSVSHSANILSRKFEEIGIAVVEGNKESHELPIIIVAIFGKRGF